MATEVVTRAAGRASMPMRIISANEMGSPVRKLGSIAAK
jgi:hypothetical protein